jgi:molybdate transport system regulatory protein
MNKLNGRIRAVESNGHLSLVDVDIAGAAFTATLLEDPDRASYLKPGTAVDVLFKETEVSLAKNLSGLISLRNRFPVTVTGIRQGQVISEISLDYRGHALRSIITTRAVALLQLAVGDEAEALVKANEISLQETADDV